ncbi:Endonuclease 8-like 1 [Bulinus truncatus]|nr:Endonuclease 8-like 1 [Bulinus truncatus]
MPEGPELQLTSLFINKTCKEVIFGGKVIKNPIHRCPDLDWNVGSYSIKSESRGKEIILHLVECKQNDNIKKASEKNSVSQLSILFTFGMSGKFEFTPFDDRPKHSHLSFITKDEPKMALSFIDQRRFGKWCVGKSWSSDRGPCVLNEYEKFAKNLADNLDDSIFKKPICEVMLNQKYFNGIGNYLRAEILFRCGIAPFERANVVLQLGDITQNSTPVSEKGKEKKKSDRKPKKSLDFGDCLLPKKDACMLSENTQLEQELLQSAVCKFQPKAQELVRCCHTVPLEVVTLGSTKYTLANLYTEDDVDGTSTFNDWLQCYYKHGMKNMADHNKRTIWFSGPAGPLAPKNQTPRVMLKSQKAKKSSSAKKEKDKSIPSKKEKQEFLQETGSKSVETNQRKNSRKRKQSHDDLYTEPVLQRKPEKVIDQTAHVKKRTRNRLIRVKDEKF